MRLSRGRWIREDAMAARLTDLALEDNLIRLNALEQVLSLACNVAAATVLPVLRAARLDAHLTVALAERVERCSFLRHRQTLVRASATTRVRRSSTLRMVGDRGKKCGVF
jgi:hypothetical protein